MKNYWLVKQEPSTYSYDKLEKEKKTVWDGVHNNLALKHIRLMKKGDQALFYHTGDEKRAVGIIEITKGHIQTQKKTTKDLLLWMLNQLHDSKDLWP